MRIYMATLTGALNSTLTHGTPEVEAKRKEYNEFIRTAGIFDGVIDFDVITLDPTTGELKAEYQPNSTLGGPGDKLHPNRAGYAAMGNSIDLTMVAGKLIRVALRATQESRNNQQGGAAMRAFATLTGESPWQQWHRWSLARRRWRQRSSTSRMPTTATSAPTACTTRALQPGARVKAASVVMPMAVSPDRRFLYAASRSKPFRGARLFDRLAAPAR